MKEKDTAVEELREQIQKAVEKERKNKEVDSKVSNFKGKIKSKEEEEQRIR